ncbi:MAG: hypothetical protein KIT60_13430 [Burkholderiaceae bacterium]|nr:hypothetical protein [Burkholderiaceae bacterium]
MNWTELCARSSNSAARSQWLLDRALAAISAAQDSALDAVIAAELPTAIELCALLDEYRVDVPKDVLSKFHGYLAPSPTRAADADKSSNLGLQPR